MNELGVNVRATDVRARIDQPLDVSAIGGVGVKAKGLGEGQVGAIASLLVPTLDGGADGAGDDGQVERPGDPPLVADLVLEDGALLGGEFLCAVYLLICVWVLGDEGTLLQVLEVLGDALLVGEVLHLEHELVLWNAGEGVLDLGLDVGREIGVFDSRAVVVALLRMRVSCILRRSVVSLAHATDST